VTTQAVIASEAKQSPSRKEEIASSQKSASRNDTLEEARILIVDDLARVREGLKMVLELEEDLKVVGEAADGLEAVNLAEMLMPDIVLMDLEMPRLDGLEATRQIKQRALAGGVVVLTIHSDSQSRERAVAVGADAFVEKGTPVGELIEVIRTFWRGSGGRQS
jgi:DNA-binding NarL/FixJ family response regulator